MKIENKHKYLVDTSIELFLFTLVIFLGPLSLAGIIRLIGIAFSAFQVDNWLLLSGSLLGASVIFTLFLVIAGHIIYVRKP